jgi:3-deoxy-D-manno-octulosonic-acid transferase
VARFLDGWRPDAGAFVDSELWPNLLDGGGSRGIPMALVNGRMSARSAALWRRAPWLVRNALGRFDLVLARSATDAARFSALGARDPQCWGDLKAAAPPLPADPAALAVLREAIGERPVFLAASTHPGEEAMAIAAHRALASDLPGLLTLIVPRHPDRGPAILAEAEAAGLAATRRAAGDAPGLPPGREVAVHVADTVGELGLFYRLAGVALVGGSLVPHGGQNPLEPARLGCPTLFGPHMGNFEEPVARLLTAGGAVRLDGPGALAPAVRDVLSDRNRGRALAVAAAAVADRDAGLPEQVAAALLGLLPPPMPAGPRPDGREAGSGTNEV